jgi:hypothetical protein
MSNPADSFRFKALTGVFTRLGASQARQCAMQGVCKGIAGRVQTRFSAPVGYGPGEGVRS